MDHRVKRTTKIVMEERAWLLRLFVSAGWTDMFAVCLFVSVCLIDWLFVCLCFVCFVFCLFFFPLFLCELSKLYTKNEWFNKQTN